MGKEQGASALHELFKWPQIELVWTNENGIVSLFLLYKA